MSTEPTASAEPSAPVQESRGERLQRHGHRARLYTWAILLALLAVVIIALVLKNRREVKLDWVIGSTRASLVWIILFSTLVGWLAGIATSILFRRRTRAPR